MTMMSEMNQYSALTEGKRLNRAATAQNDVLRAVLEQVTERTAEGGWRSVVFADGFSQEQEKTLSSLGVTRQELETEDAFAVFGEGDALTVCASNFRGKLYGAYAILQQAQANGGRVPGGVLFNAPQCPFRGLKVYLPAPGDIGEFYRLIDFLLYYRNNTIIIEIGGAMEYKKHPEINESWIEYCREMARYPERADEVQTMFGWSKNSIHFENGGGAFLPQETVRGLVQYCRDRGMEVIPEVPSLSHADYLLNAHQELAERPYDPYPDVYCPSNPKSYELLFDVLDEVIEVFEPETVHIGHDECYSLGLCERCKEKDPAEIYAGDITKIHDYLVQRGIRTMYWSEKVINAITKAGARFGGADQTHTCSRNTTCHVAATYRSIDLIPQDCWAHNWYWSIVKDADEEFNKRGMKMTFGNWSPTGIIDWQQRVDAGALGGAPSHWTTLSEPTLQRNGVFLEVVYGAELLWNRGYTKEAYPELFERCAQELFLYKNRETLRQPHFLITHRTTFYRPWVYLTSAPMLMDKDTIGKYIVTYQSGRTLEIPLVYGINIMNPYRSWRLEEDAEIDCYRGDSSLAGITFSTLPVRQDNGETFFTIAVKNPYPGDPVVSVQVENMTGGKGEILMSSFEADDCAPAFDEDSVELQRHY